MQRCTAMQSNYKYNDIYDLLIDGDSDVMGVIAYAFYKKDKVEWIKKHIDLHGQQPDENQLKAFYESASTSVSLDGYKQQAKEILTEYVADLRESLEKDVEDMSIELEERLEQLESEYQEQLEEYKAELDKKYNEELVSKIQGIYKEPFMVSIFKSVLGSIIFVLFVGLAYFFMWSLENTNPTKDVKDSIQSTLQHDNNQTKE